LIRASFSGQNHGSGAGETRLGGTLMDGNARLILVTTMTGVVVLVVTLVLTYFHIGLRSDFVLQWMEAYFVGWPVAVATDYFIMPAARRVTTRIMNRIDGTA
jgi:uncharacterized protein DUF2798